LLQFATSRYGQSQQKECTFERNALQSSLRYHPHLQIWFVRLMWWSSFSLGSQMLLHIGTCHLTFEPHESVLVRWVFCTSLQLWNWVMTPVEMCVSLLFWYLAAANLFWFQVQVLLQLVVTLGFWSCNAGWANRFRRDFVWVDGNASEFSILWHFSVLNPRTEDHKEVLLLLRWHNAIWVNRNGNR
jgi:hypothetical protein